METPKSVQQAASRAGLRATRTARGDYEIRWIDPRVDGAETIIETTRTANPRVCHALAAIKRAASIANSVCDTAYRGQAQEFARDLLTTPASALASRYAWRDTNHAGSPVWPGQRSALFVFRDGSWLYLPMASINSIAD